MHLRATGPVRQDWHRLAVHSMRSETREFRPHCGCHGRVVVGLQVANRLVMGGREEIGFAIAEESHISITSGSVVSSSMQDPVIKNEY